VDEKWRILQECSQPGMTVSYVARRHGISPSLLFQRRHPCLEYQNGLESNPGGRLDVKKRFSEEQIIGFLREADAGMPMKDLCRKHGFSEASFYLWRSKFGGMEVSDAKRLKTLEAENARLKKLLAESLLENEVTREALRKKF
jgi:putative transposase